MRVHPVLCQDPVYVTTVTQPEISAGGDEASAGQSFLPYAQLARMLVPSSRALSLYDAAGELRWSSDGYERPDLREFVDALKSGTTSGRASLRTTAAGTMAYAAALPGDDGVPLGFLVIELKSDRNQAKSLATHLLNPLVDCLHSRLRAEAQAAGAAAAGRLDASEIDFLIGVSELETGGPEGLRELLDRCIATLDCAAAAFVSPDPKLTVIVEREADASGTRADVVERTRRHLLAWAQLNNRPMVVNRVGAAAGAAPFKILSCPVKSADEGLTGLVALFRAATGQNFELRDVNLLEFLCRRVVTLLSAREDPLTGLVGRAAFEAFVAESAPGAPADGGIVSASAKNRNGALIEVAIDGLQPVNDAYGLDVGDAMIREIAMRLKATLGSTGVATRMAGDRFAIFVPDVTEAGACEVADRLLAAVAASEIRSGQASIKGSVSIGLAVAGAALATTGELVAAARTAADTARAEGGSRYVLYEPEKQGPALQASEIFAAARLRTALDTNRFRLLAQPIVELANSAAPVGYEVLVRLPDETGVLQLPDEFIGIARRYGLTPAVDTWVFSETLRRLEPHAGEVAELPIGVAVNVSEQSLLSKQYVDAIVSEIARSPLPGRVFSFEIAESDALGNLDAAEAFIERVRDTGARVALDRFGSGLTSFAQLRRLRVDYLKVGGELVRGMAEDRHLESMVLGLAKAAQSLELPTVAEHVESAELVGKLEAMGIVYGQGFVFGRPQPLKSLFTGGTAPIGL